MADLAMLADEKRFYERFYALHNDPVLVELVKRFGVEVLRRSCVLEGFEAFIKQTEFRGKRCLEIGTCKGLTAVVLSRYFDDVVSIDIMPDEQRIAVREACGAHNVRFVGASDNARKAHFVNSIDFDAAFVDGNHANDTGTDFALVRRCGRVLFHEYWQAQPPVWHLVEALRKSGLVQAHGKFALWTTPGFVAHG